MLEIRDRLLFGFTVNYKEFIPNDERYTCRNEGVWALNALLYREAVDITKKYQGEAYEPFDEGGTILFPYDVEEELLAAF